VTGQPIHADDGSRPEEEALEVSLTVNGAPIRRRVPVRRLLSDFLRHDLGLRGTHVGCEHGVCGCCTVLVDGRSARSCLLLTPQCEGAAITTIEGLSPADRSLSVVQQAFRDAHGLQCGYCTPGFVVTVTEFLEHNRGRTDFSDEELRAAIAGNLCRCTGYQGIVDAVRLAAARLAGARAEGRVREPGGPAPRFGADGEGEGEPPGGLGVYSPGGATPR
jgi:carbon-monoxide dehydrogenase small subunit